MENIILEMKKIVEESKREGSSFVKIRNRLKEYLHYFVLDFIYNSEFKDMVFYGGSCLSIVYGLNRMSIDLDFEVEEGMDFSKFKKLLRKYFSVDLGLKDKFCLTGKQSGKYVNRIFLNFPLMNEIDLSAHKEEVLKVRIDIMVVPKDYLRKLKPVFTLKSKYGRSFVIRHYDLPTLFASKLAAILDRPQKGFAVGKDEEEISFKGRDFYDLIWYMEERILPNEVMLKLKGIKGSVGDVFDEIALFVSQTKLKTGLKKDLEPLFIGPIDSFVDNFRPMFQRLRERYTARKIKKLDRVVVVVDFHTDIHNIKLDYLCEDGARASFLFRLSEYFIVFAEGKVDLEQRGTESLSKLNDKIEFRTPTEKERIKEYVALFISKINDYLRRHNNEVYFERWESKFIRMTDDNFNPEKEIVFGSGQELTSNKKVTLESLSL